MSISGIGGSGMSFGISSTNKGTGATEDFMNFMKLTPEQRLQEAWLAKHGITKEEFDAMSPEEQQALMDKMKLEIKQEMESKLKEGRETKGVLDIFA